MNFIKKVDARDSVKVVTLNEFVTACGLENISLKARKLLYIAMAQCKMNDKEFYEYVITPAEFAHLMGIDASNVYEEADNITDELMKGFIKYIPENKKKFEKFQLFEKCNYDDNYEIRFKLSKEMTPILIDLKKNFLQPYLSDFLKMKSNFSMQIWHLFQREMKSRKPGTFETIQFDLSVEDLREVTGCKNKFKQIGQFKDFVLDKALREIKDNCGVDITYENIKKSRTVVGFRFSAQSLFHYNIDDIKPETVNRVRFFLLKKEAEQRELTDEEQKEFNILEKKYNNS